MKKLLKKSISVVVMLVMLVQMVCSVFAGTYTWTDGGTHIASVTASGPLVDRVYKLTAPTIYHPVNFENYATIPAGTHIEYPAETDGFRPVGYKSYLNEALKNEGYQPVGVYDNGTTAEKVTIPSYKEEGIYAAKIVFVGCGGTWWIRGASTPDGAPSMLYSGTYNYAPKYNYTTFYKVG